MRKENTNSDITSRKVKSKSILKGYDYYKGKIQSNEEDDELLKLLKLSRIAILTLLIFYFTILATALIVNIIN